MISKDTISLVRDRTDVVAVISETVPTLKKRGRRFLGLCPFHQEKTPSFHVNPDTGLYHCFGCKESGDVFRFLERVEGYSFVEAVRALAERSGIAIALERGAAPTDADRRKRERDGLYDVMQMASVWYEQQLRQHPQAPSAIAELARRDLTLSSDVVQAFRVGYAPPEWEGLASYFKAQGVSPALAESLGLIAPRQGGGSRGYYDRFRHRLMFAVMDVRGRVIAFSGRALPPPAGSPPPADPPPKYVNSPESPIYVKGSHLFGLWQARHSIRHKEQAILVEGNFDVVSLHARGVDNVVAPLGTAFTGEQAILLHRYATRVTLLFDGDQAGRKATRAAEQPCADAEIEAQVAALPDRVDPDEFVRSTGAEALRHVLAQGRGMVEYLIDSELDESFNASDSRECAARVDRVVAVIDRQTDAVQRALAEAYADRAAGRLDLLRSAPLAWPALKRKFLAMRGAARPTSAARPMSRGVERNAHESFARNGELRTARGRVSSEGGQRPVRSGQAERKTIVGALLDFPVLLEDSETRAVLDLLEGESARIVAAMQQSMRVNSSGQKVLDSSEFLAQMPPVIQAFASARLAAPQHDTIDDARATLAVNAKKLEAGHVAQGKTEIVRAERRAVGDWETEVELMKSAEALVRQKHGFEGTRVENAASEVGAGVRTRVGQKHRGSDGDQES